MSPEKRIWLRGELHDYRHDPRGYLPRRRDHWCPGAHAVGHWPRAARRPVFAGSPDAACRGGAHCRRAARDNARTGHQCRPRQDADRCRARAGTAMKRCTNPRGQGRHPQGRRSGVTSSACPDVHARLDPGRRGHRLTRPGLVAGAVLRAARLSARIDEASLAAAGQVAEHTVWAWERGSAPLASVPAPDLDKLQAALSDAGADPQLVADIGAAAWCDLVILAVVQNADTTCMMADPLASETAFGELLAWALAGRVPPRYEPSAIPGPLLDDLALIERVIQVLNATHPQAAAAWRLVPLTGHPPRQQALDPDRVDARDTPAGRAFRP